MGPFLFLRKKGLTVTGEFVLPISMLIWQHFLEELLGEREGRKKMLSISNFLYKRQIKVRIFHELYFVCLLNKRTFQIVRTWRH